MRKIVPLLLLLLLLCGCAANSDQSPAQRSAPLSPSAEALPMPASSSSEPSPLIPSIPMTATPSPSSLYRDDRYISKEGTLENGRKYVFYGTDKQSFSIEKYIEKAGLFKYQVFDIRIQEKKIEAVAERIQALFGFGLVNAAPEKAGLTIYYDEETEALMFSKDYYGVPQVGGSSYIVVSCKDGLTTMYSDRYC